MPLVLSVSDEDANHTGGKYLMGPFHFPPAWTPKPLQASTSQAKAPKDYSSLYNTSSKAKPTATPVLLMKLIHSFLATNADDQKAKSGVEKTVAFDKRKVECSIAQYLGDFARECKYKGQRKNSRKQVRSIGRATTDDRNSIMPLMAFNVNNEANQIFEKDEKLKKYRRIGMKAVKDKDVLQKIVDSWFASSKNLWKLVDCGMSSTVKMGLGDGEFGTMFNANSTVYSSCQSNDSDGDQGTISDHTVQDNPTNIPSIEQVTIATQTTQPQMPEHQQTVDPSCHIALKTPRQPIKNTMQATPAWTNSNRVNKANQFTPRPVQLSNFKPKFSTASRAIKTGRVNVNTGKQNVSSGSLHVSSGTHIKSGTSRVNAGKQNVNSGSIYVNSGTKNKSGSSRVNTGKQNANSGRVSPENRPFTKNTAYKSNNYAVKGTMGTAVKTSAGCVWRKTTPLSNTNSGPTPDSNVHDHPLKAMEHREGKATQALLPHGGFSSTSLFLKIATKKTQSSRQPSQISYNHSPLCRRNIMTFRNELDALALKHLGPVPTTVSTSTNPVNTCSINLNTVNTEAISPSAIDHGIRSLSLMQMMMICLK
ncbi:hypothetical protein Tco_0015055 [Tanacetum coccineum]